jgi:hypothetical protein
VLEFVFFAAKKEARLPLDRRVNRHSSSGGIQAHGKSIASPNGHEASLMNGVRRALADADLLGFAFGCFHSLEVRGLSAPGRQICT